jgi:hypothetical protein
MFILYQIVLGGMRCVDHVANIGEIKNTDKNLGRQPERKIPLGRPRR